MRSARGEECVVLAMFVRCGAQSANKQPTWPRSPGILIFTPYRGRPCTRLPLTT